MGVKSLWTLLTPVGRPVMLETVEGKVMAIDSSIWLYQFQATMRDKEGRALVNAHVLGFLRRISKLLFFGIKPVFVFDGGAPALKRSTLNERKKKKSGAASTHIKLAEKILAAQMRREALNQAQSNQSNSKNSKGKNRQPADVLLDENTVFLEDIDGSAPKTPVKRRPPTPSSSSTKKNKFYDHDPYKLPEVNLDEAITKATRSAAPDPRLATEDELRDFIEQMRPEDFDINSPEFRELPTEVQYEIIGDLRLKSRQTSYARLQRMLKSAPTPLDFSKQQIKNLRQRNALTQQLLMTTDTIGKANIVIPVRIASERNREYVLMKNEGVDGGWILGIKDIGTREKPIVIDHEEAVPEEEEDEDSDVDMEEVEVPTPTFDPDLREYQRETVLAGISRRENQKIRSTANTIERKRRSAALPALYSSNGRSPSPMQESDEYDILAYVIQESLDQSKSKAESSTRVAPTSEASTQRDISLEDDFYVNRTPRTRLETALSFANSGSNRTRTTPSKNDNINSMFGPPTLLSATNKSLSMSDSTSDDRMEEIPPFKSNKDDDAFALSLKPESSLSENKFAEADTDIPQNGIAPSSMFGRPTLLSSGIGSAPRNDGVLSTSSGQFTLLSSVTFDSLPQKGDVPTTTFGQPTLLSPSIALDPSKSNSVMDNIVGNSPVDFGTENPEREKLMPTGPQAQQVSSNRALEEGSSHSTPPSSDDFLHSVEKVGTDKTVSPTTLDSYSDEDMEEIPVESFVSYVQHAPKHTHQQSTSLSASHPPYPHLEEGHSTFPSTKDTGGPPQVDSSDTDEEPLFSWSRTPSPMRGNGSRPPSPTHWDAVEEIDINVEEGEFARFMSQVKGKNMDDVRKEIDAEITGLNQQRKNAMRDSEDITQQMVAQIMTMLRLFGIPYITAPMEAEAQCAELVSLELVDGVITDDSDVFLFGAQRVYKNMFNQSKTVECFLLTDLSRELGLNRDTLIQLAYLLGSDYTEGLPGVGPVVAMELLKEFPGHSGLHKFKDWWAKVQSGKDREEDNQSKFRKQFKKKFKNLYLPPDWPNSVVRDAYYHPTVDSSEEPFKWGMPDLDGLRAFFRQELGWSQAKVDELILPILQRMNRRNQTAALNKQGNLNDFLDISAGSGTHAPRQSRAYQSKRLQQVISDFRMRQKSGSAPPASPSRSNTPPQEDKSEASNSGGGNPPPSKKQKTKTAGTSTKGKGKSKATPAAKTRKTKTTTSVKGSRGIGRRRGGAQAKKGKTVDPREDNLAGSDDEVDNAFVPPDDDEAVVREATLNLRPRPRPRPIPKGGRTAEPSLEPTKFGEGQPSHSPSPS